jgi:hypothetical protein
MRISLIDHVMGAGRTVTYDGSSRLRLGSRVDEVMRRVSDLQRRSGEVLRAGRTSTVLVQDQDVTYALEPWSNWQYEHGVLAAVSHLALPPAEATEAGQRELLGRVTQAVLASSLAPFSDHEHEAEAGCCISSTELQNSYREALDTADTGTPVVISYRQTPISVLEPFPLRNRESEFIRHVHDLFRFRASAQVAADTRTPIGDWVPTSPYPWLAVFPRDVIDEFADEMLPTLLEAFRDNDPETYARALTAWQASSLARGDDELARALRTPVAAVARMRVQLTIAGDAKAD